MTVVVKGTTSNTIVAKEAPNTAVVEQNTSPKVIQVRSQGMQGIPGNTANLPAGEIINAYRVLFLDSVTQKVFKADAGNAISKFSIIGINTFAVVADEMANILINGAIINSGWNWDMSTGDLSLYLGANGLITQTIPTSGYLLKLGCATSPTSMLLNISENVTLA